MEMPRPFGGDKHVLLLLSLSIFVVAQTLTYHMDDCIE